MIAVALDYAKRGWPVFPLRPPTNAPAIPRAHPKGDPLHGKCRGECGRSGHGFHDATTNLDTIRAWWASYPEANIGIPTGVAFDVLDVDHEDLLIGVADLPECETLGGPVARSGGGKWHLYFNPSGLGRRIRFSAYCDWLGTDGYVVAPPSTHRLGGTYSWFSSPDLSLTAAPAALIAAVRPPAPRPALPAPQTLRTPGWSPAGLVAKVAIAAEGKRNDVLNWAAHKLGLDVHATRVDERDALDALEQIAVAAERSGLTGREVDNTIRSGYTAGRAGVAAR